MELVTVDIHDDPQAGDFFAVYHAAHIEDTPDKPPPLRDQFLALGRQEHSEVQVAFEGVRRDDQLVGAGMVVMPTVDNRHIADVRIWVHPHHRRLGVGRALLQQLTRRVSEAGRTTLFAQAVGPVPGGPPRSEAGARFLTAAGFTAALSMRSRRIDLCTIDHSAEQSLLDECLPHASGYRRKAWVGQTPESFAPGVAYLANRMVTDAPRGDLDIEETTVDAERLRTEEQEFLAAGSHLVTAVAMHCDSGGVAAVTSVAVRPPGDHGFVRTTIAHPQHRGHRLGTLVKIDAHRRLRELFPELRYVTTSNAETNAHMVAVNERLGYLVYEVGTNFQRRLD